MAKEKNNNFLIGSTCDIEHIMPASGSNLQSIRKDAGMKDEGEVILIGAIALALGGEEMADRFEIKEKLKEHFSGKIVRKDLAKQIKEGANVPVYVLEFLLGQYCCSDEEDVIESGVTKVKKILADNFVRPDEAQKILSILRQKGTYSVIDKITVNLNIKNDIYEAEFSNLVKW